MPITPNSESLMLRRVSVAAVLAFCAGCGGGPATAPVSGRVTLDGQPLPNAAVMFQPFDPGNNNPGPGSGGKTDEEGRYTLTVIGTQANGAVVAKHKVRINMAPPESKPDDDRPKKYKQLPLKYHGKDTILEFDVPSRGTTSADFDLKSK
jgi:hypothetical protein